MCSSDLASEERRRKRRTTFSRNCDGLQASEERRYKCRTTFHRKCDSLQTSEARRFVRRPKSDACSEATEEVSIVRHFLRASKLRRQDKPRFVRPRTVALATTMCRNSDKLAIGISAKFSSAPRKKSCLILLNASISSLHYFVDPS